MKRIVASVGLVALGTSALQAVDAGALSTMQTSKPWSASLSLRGFYDDNINAVKNGKQGSFGIEINPSVGVAVAADQTSASANYMFSGKYYEHKPAGNSTSWDYTHIFDVAVQHAFSPRVRLAVTDSFVVGQEPDTLSVNNAIAAPQRISGDNMRNYGTINLNLEATQLLGFEVGYANGWFNYADHGAVTSGTPVDTVVASSRSGVLDRIEHSAHIDSRWHFAPQTVGILGYMYGETDYTGDELIQGNLPAGIPLSMSDTRNSRSHFVYVGVEHSFNPQLSSSVRVGAQYIDFFNDGTSSVSPYIETSLKYTYSADGQIAFGTSHRRSTTDYVGTTSVVSDADTTTVYASVTHRILPRLYGTMIGTFQYQRFNGGGPGSDDEADRFFLLGLDASYRFNQHLSAHVGYNLDFLDSGVSSRDYTRNRFYIGMTAEY